MGGFLSQYISQNWMDMIVSLFIGIIATLIFVQKNPNSSVQNNTDIREVRGYIKKIIIIKEPSIQRKENDNSVIFLILILGAIASFFFIKYYSVILDVYASVIVVILTSTLGIAIKLYRNNQYDKLNRFWTLILFAINAFNLWNLSIMSKLDLTNVDVTSFSAMIESIGISGLTDYFYRTLGFFTAMLPNIVSILLLVHIIAVNKLLIKNNRFSIWIVRHTIIFTKPLFLLTMTFLVVVISLLFTSGIAYEFIGSLNS
ncbi:hypothetical protein SAMN04487943_103351 [Gracilibacillus orientalis]|uniref:Uncharacterized protein n=1 Tax=Gracilibacillus orientalis TaxID=334253 RepID=A0A1I4K4I8_9BACI|nr:hypothetical protein [Gracilibacillus orientalis]SFL73690.1 hypothetical protein SAMN04487943_103351 [Gracilibacillus orientalis]